MMSIKTILANLAKIATKDQDDSLQKDIDQNTFDIAHMEDPSEITNSELLDQTQSTLLQENQQNDPELVQQLAMELKEALKFGPVKIMTTDGNDAEVHIPQTWNGALSGLPFAANMDMGGMMMTFNIPHKIPITLMVAVKDEFSLYETAQSIDFGMAVAIDPNSQDPTVIAANSLRLTWLISFLKIATMRVRENMKSQSNDKTISMMVSAQDVESGIKRAETMLMTLDDVRTRLETALSPYNVDGLMTQMSRPQGNEMLH